MASTFELLLNELKRMKKPTKRQRQAQAIAAADAILIAEGLKSYSDLVVAIK